MKNSLLLKSLAIVGIAVLAFQACKKEKTYELQTLVAAGVDLNGASSATGVAATADIVATFSEPINASTANSTNITLVRDYDNAAIPTTISVSGNVVTINPNEDLGSGTLYELSFGGAVAYADGKANVAAFSRTFTTAGTFAPAGAIAHWTFENNAEDQAGSNDASAVVAVTYENSRNGAAGKAATFNGDNSIIEVPNGDLLMNTSNFTLSFWVKAVSDNHPNGQFVMGLAAFYGFQFEITGDYSWCKLAGRYDLGNNTTGSEDLWFPGDGKTFANGGWQGWDFCKDLTASGGVAGLLKDKWAHVVCVYNGATRQGIMYINGEKMKSFDFDLWPDGDAKRNVTGLKYGGTAPETVNELAFGFIQSRAGTLWDTETWGGYDFPEANHFKGQLDDVRIFHKVLTDQEILLMYNSEK
ncbi:MAG: Ig-like domain-containing protein [Saprospiraceae bacterium]|nr:Ig-like domain-containing protein [Saprospiraceae bacterium]